MEIIYKITSPSGKAYIGQTTGSLTDRFRQHFWKSSKHKSLKRAILKYEAGAFKKKRQSAPKAERRPRRQVLCRSRPAEHTNGRMSAVCMGCGMIEAEKHEPPLPRL